MARVAAVEPPSIRALDSEIPRIFCFHKPSRPTTCLNYYLFFYYLYMFPEWSKNRGGMFPEWSKIGFANVPRMVVENCPDSHKPVEIGYLRHYGDPAPVGMVRGTIRRGKAADGPLRGQERGD